MIRFGVILPLVTLCLVAGEDNARESKFKLSNNKKLRQTFNNLLSSVTNVNQERFDAMKRLHELQTYVPTVSRTRNKLLAVIIPKLEEEETEYLNIKEPSDHRSTRSLIKYIAGNDESDTDESDTGESDTRETSLRVYKGCNKKASKHCIDACKQTIKDLCSEYKCSKSMKKYGKKICKSNCKEEFVVDRR